MTASRMTFGEHLKQFALSIDFIDATYYELVQQHIKTYLEIQLDATQVAFFERTTVDDCEGMTTVWSAPIFCVHQTLEKRSKKPREDAQTSKPDWRRQLALAIGESRNLWVVNETRERLDEDNPGIDLWGEEEDHALPPFYPSPEGEPSRTAIIMITHDARGHANGALLVEIRPEVRPTRILRREMQLLADAVGLLHATDVATREQRAGTFNAINRLADLIPSLELDTGPKPLLFVASSNAADKTVMKVIDEVLKEFKEQICVRHWGEMHRPGNINMQLVNEIRSAQYGVCYLSEPMDSASQSRVSDGSETPLFQDNPNVLVEAGMLHMVTRASGTSDTGWIPIREQEEFCPDDVPFDLENQRMVFVRRTKRNGAYELDCEGLATDLKSKLASLLESGSADQDQETTESVTPHPEAHPPPRDEAGTVEPTSADDYRT